MKKIMMIIALSVFTIGLSACGLGDVDDVVDDNPIVDDDNDNNDDNGNNDDPNLSPEEAAALALTEQYDGDLTFLANRMEAMDLASAHEIETVLTVDYDNAFTEEIDTVVIEITERYLEYTDGVLIQQDQVFTENGMVMASLSMITDYQGDSMTVYVDITDVYDQIEMMVSTELLDAFGIESGWAKFTFSDSMTNMLEIELFGEFLRAVVVAQDPMLEDLESIEDDIVAMLGVDKVAANIELQMLFDTLFTFDLNAVMAHVFDVNVDVLIDGGIENVLEPELLSMMAMYETELRAAGIPYDTYYNTLSTDGLFTLLETMTVDDAAIVGSFVGIPFLNILVAEYDPDFTNAEFAHAVILALLPTMQADIDMIEGVDYDDLYAALLGLDINLFLTQVETFDYNAMVMSLVNGTYMEFYDTMTETEIKRILDVFNTMIINQYGPLTAALSYDILLNDIDRFDRYKDISTYLTDPSMVTNTPTVDDDYIVETQAFITYDMLENVSQSFLQDAWLWLDQLDYIDLPEVDPINCSGAECETVDPYIELLSMLSSMDDMPVTFTVDPLDDGTMWLTADVSNLLNLIEDPTGETTPYTAVVDVTVRDTTTIDEITEVTDLNQTLEAFAKYMFIDEIRMILEDVSWYMDVPEGEPAPLETVIDGAQTLGIFDSTLTTFTQNGNDIEATFVYIDGTDVFTDVVTLTQLNAIYDDGDVTQTEMLAYIDLLDDSTFSMTRLLLLYMSEDMYHQLPEEPTDPLK